MTNKQDMKNLAVEYHNSHMDIVEFDKQFNKLFEVREQTHQVSMQCAREASAEIERERILKLIVERRERAIKDICKNMNVRRKTLCQLGTLGLMTIEDLVETFYGEDIKREIKEFNKEKCRKTTKKTNKIKNKEIK